MIVFEGKNSLECRKKAYKQFKKMQCIGILGWYLTALCLFGIIAVLDAFTLKWFFLILGLLLLTVPLQFLGGFFIKRSFFEKSWERRIEFTASEVISTYNADSLNSVKESYTLPQIRKIIDRDLYFEVVVKEKIFARKRELICEKSLITEGSLEEFERAFLHPILACKD